MHGYETTQAPQAPSFVIVSGVNVREGNNAKADVDLALNKRLRSCPRLWVRFLCGGHAGSVAAAEDGAFTYFRGKAIGVGVLEDTHGARRDASI